VRPFCAAGNLAHRKQRRVRAEPVFRPGDRSLGRSLGRTLLIMNPTLSGFPHRRNPAHARSGFGRSRSIRRRISANSARGTATSASWKTT
jgi:hypothetical protein